MITLYTLKQVSEMTGFALRTLERDARADKFVHVHRGRDRFMTQEQIEDLVAQSITGKPQPKTQDDEGDKISSLMKDLSRRRS